MGTGKTHVAQQYLNQHPHASVLAVTFRISLAKYLSINYSKGQTQKTVMLLVMMKAYLTWY
jgi:hypothetical protein